MNKKVIAAVVVVLVGLLAYASAVLKSLPQPQPVAEAAEGEGE